MARWKTTMTQIFLQSELLNDIEVIDLDEGASKHDLRQACLDRVGGDHLPEPLILYIEDEDDENAIDKMDAIVDGLRLHLHRLKAITVTVRYAGRQEHHTFRPNATIARVKRWAAHALGITASDAAELMLQIAGTDNRPDPDVHLGSLVKAPQHTVCFDLVPAPRVNG
ncbi:hypothetical protein [Ralstonia sp. Ralssp110]|jgi:hypothetical protein|uniref:hypothetical protein n=1 Tax=Ralstonia sp. Ralssp110 TaxID=3243004 RepID=UPI0039B637D8